MVYEIDFLNRLVNFLIYLHSVLDNQHHVLLKIHRLFYQLQLLHDHIFIYLKPEQIVIISNCLTIQQVLLRTIKYVVYVKNPCLFLCLRKKTKLSAFISIRGQVFWHLRIYVSFSSFRSHFLSAHMQQM
jgi:hypothetical protein